MEADRPGDLGLFGVEIGGPEDGFGLEDASAFVSARDFGALFIDVRPIWSSLEPSPGSYDWQSLDSGLGNASSVGLPVTVTMRFFDGQVPGWFQDENMIDQNGRGFFGYGGEDSFNPSYWGPKSRHAYLKLVEETVRRYRDNNSIIAWQFFYGYNDSFYLGMWKREAVYDYSEFSQSKFREYLSEVKGLSLDDLEERYGVRYDSWEQVSQPKPDFGKLNTSLAWHDFQDYRMWSIEVMFRDIFEAIRALDDRPLIMYYGGSLHHSAHELNVYDVGLRLLREYGGSLDITCFEDPVPAEIGSGIVRSYGVPLMCEAWQVPPPLPDFRRLFFHAFALGAKSYQLVGNWTKLQASSDEFKTMQRVFSEMVKTVPIRAPIAGLLSYRTILSRVPARHYINPTLALIPRLQEHQYSLDWHSDLSPLEDLARYEGLLDANSEVLSEETIWRLADYVKGGGRLILLARSGRCCLDSGEQDFPLLEALQRPDPQHDIWDCGRGAVYRIPTEEIDSDAGTLKLLEALDWVGVTRPITATQGIHACMSSGPAGRTYATLLWPKEDSCSGTFSVSPEHLEGEGPFKVTDLVQSDHMGDVSRERLMSGVPISFSAYELKVLVLEPVW